MGQAFITVTNVDAYRQKLQVEVDWQEHTPLGNRNKKEFCTTDIANEIAVKLKTMKTNNRAFTLVEILVAVAISVCCAALYWGHISW